MTDRDDSHLALSYALHPGDVSDAPNNAVNPADDGERMDDSGLDRPNGTNGDPLRNNPPRIPDDDAHLSAATNDMDDFANRSSTEQPMILSTPSLPTQINLPPPIVRPWRTPIVQHTLAPMLEHEHVHQPPRVTRYANTPAPTPDVAVLDARAATLNRDYLRTAGHTDYDPNPYDLTMNMYDMGRFYAAFGPTLRNDTVPLPVAPDGRVFYVPIHHVIHHFAPSGRLLIDRPTDTSPDAGRDNNAPIARTIPLSLSRTNHPLLHADHTPITIDLATGTFDLVPRTPSPTRSLSPWDFGPPQPPRPRTPEPIPIPPPRVPSPDWMDDFWINLRLARETGPLDRYNSDYPTGLELPYYSARNVLGNNASSIYESSELPPRWWDVPRGSAGHASKPLLRTAHLMGETIPVYALLPEPPTRPAFFQTFHRATALSLLGSTAYGQLYLHLGVDNDLRPILESWNHFYRAQNGIPHARGLFPRNFRTAVEAASAEADGNDIRGRGNYRELVQEYGANTELLLFAHQRVRFRGFTHPRDARTVVITTPRAGRAAELFELEAEFYWAPGRASIVITEESRIVAQFTHNALKNADIFQNLNTRIKLALILSLIPISSILEYHVNGGELLRVTPSLTWPVPENQERTQALAWQLPEALNAGTHYPSPRPSYIPPYVEYEEPESGDSD